MVTSLFCDNVLLPEGWSRNVTIRIDDDLIAAIAPGSQPQRGDERVAIALPGLPNLHSHAFQRGMAGLTEIGGPSVDSFWTWRDVMYRFLRHLTPDDVEAIATQLFVEMVEQGFTRVGEFHYLHHDIGGRPYADPAEMAARIAAAAAASGIGLTLLPVFYAHGGFGGQPPTAGQARFVTNPESFARLLAASRESVAHLPGAIVGVAPHSLRAVAEAELAHIVALPSDGPIHIHAAEQRREVDDCLAWSGERSVEWILNRQDVNERWCLIHATHMTAEETAALARTGAVAGLCPITEANLGDGVFDLPGFARAGGRYGVGTDSNVSIGLADELRMLEYGQRLVQQSRNVASASRSISTGRALFNAALAGGSRATGLVTIGLEVGAPADVVELDDAHVALAGRSGDAVLDTMIFAAPHEMIRNVWVRGRKLVSDGRHRHRDSAAANFRAAMEALLREIP